jgi:hypothetical protein
VVPTVDETSNIVYHIPNGLGDLHPRRLPISWRDTL